MVKQARSAITRERFLDAAANEFARHGYSDSNLQDVIARTSLTKGALYGHFSSKRRLASVLAEQLDDALDRLLDSGQARRGPVLETLRALSCSFSERIESDVRFNAGIRLALDTAQRSLEKPVFADRVRHTVLHLVEQGQRDGEVSSSLASGPLADLMVVMLVGAYCTAPITDHPDLTGRVRDMWDILLPALRQQAGE